MALPTSYRAGFISVQNNSRTVIGTGTSFVAAGIRPGDILYLNGFSVSVDAVNSATSLTLRFPWPGATISNTLYEIVFTPDATRIMAGSREAIDAINSARDAVYSLSHVYNNVADGIAGVKTNGAQFLVKSGNTELIRYRRDDATRATEISRHATPLAINNALLEMQVAAAGAADSIRGEVKADADRAAAAAATAAAAAAAFAVVRQEGSGLPARPAGVAVVFWFTWDDPSDTGAKLMGPNDIWFEQEAPEPAAQIAAADWELFNRMTGRELVIRRKVAAPAQQPPILATEYRIDGGNPVALPSSGAGDYTVTLPAAGTYAVEIRDRNFVGGVWSSLKVVNVNSQPFFDDFERPNNYIEATGLWIPGDRTAKSSQERMRVVSNAVRPSNGANKKEWAAPNAYFTPDQFAEADIVQTDSATRLWEFGAFVFVRNNYFPDDAQNGYDKGFRLRIRTTSWAILNGSSQVASGPLPAGTTFPLKARLEARGDQITALINGVPVHTLTSAAWPTGYPGISGRYENQSWIIDNFRAGPLV